MSTTPRKTREPSKARTAKQRSGDTRSPYHAGIPDEARDIMAKGYSKTVVAASLGISRKVFWEWERRHLALAEALKEGEMLSQLWWETEGLKAMQGGTPGFNAAVWIFNMKNRFGWRDKQEITGDDDKPVSVTIMKFADKK